MNDQDTRLTSKTEGPGTMFRIIVPASIFTVTAIIGAFMILTKPKPTPKPMRERAAVVNTVQLKSSSEKIILHTTGTVKPAEEIILFPRSSGEIIRVSPKFIPGGQFAEDELILQIDPADYEIALTNAYSALAKAEFELKTEEGLQDIARYEWSSLKSMNEGKESTPLEEELATRQPHLKLAQSNLSSARAHVKQAELNLRRTEVKAPFDCVIRSRNVNRGSLVSPQTALAQLSGTESLWIFATVPVASLQWITSADEINDRGSAVTVSSVPGIDHNAEWNGHVLRKMVDIEQSGKQAQLLIEVPAPDKPAEGKGRLLLGSYVRLRIEGITVDKVFKIPGSAIHNGSELWLMSKDSRLDVRPVNTLWSGSESVYVSSGAQEGETLVISSLGTPIQGMLLKRPEDAGPAARKSKKEKK